MYLRMRRSSLSGWLRQTTWTAAAAARGTLASHVRRQAASQAREEEEEDGDSPPGIITTITATATDLYGRHDSTPRQPGKLLNCE